MEDRLCGAAQVTHDWLVHDDTFGRAATRRAVLDRLVSGAIRSFRLSLENRVVLTEAATGNYAVTAVLAARAGARVFAYTRDSRFGTAEEAAQQTYALASLAGVEASIEVIASLGQAPLDTVDVLTNTGFLRPIDATLVERLPRTCVIPLMW